MPDWASCSPFTCGAPSRGSTPLATPIRAPARRSSAESPQAGRFRAIEQAPNPRNRPLHVVEGTGLGRSALTEARDQPALAKSPVVGVEVAPRLDQSRIHEAAMDPRSVPGGALGRRCGGRRAPSGRPLEDLDRLAGP